MIGISILSALTAGGSPDLSAIAGEVWTFAFALLAGLLLLSGLDDLIPASICIWHHLRRKPRPPAEEGPQRRIAIFVPCWNESAVIGNMVRQNMAAIRYKHFDFFLGVYPNDLATLRVATQLSEAFDNVHVAECANPGPTSKADCLNWIFQRMLLFEETHSAYFDTVVLHDAEDLIHPDALSIIDRERAHYEMVQIPVLPLPTPAYEVTHGVYCDEFSEFQFIDMPARQYSGSFVPSNGVGTGFAREILDRLATERHNLVFDAASLTEDYEIGVYIHSRGLRQVFVDLAKAQRGWIATKEYFPRRVGAAIRQRSRWVTGIALQTWERVGWSGPVCRRYWFWRDRKGLLANPLSFLTNLVFLAGIIDWLMCQIQHRPWVFGFSHPAMVRLCQTTFGLQCLRIAIRMMCVGRIYGVVFASLTPVRCLHGNLINCFASVRAIVSYVRARRRRERLAWTKTDHAYPTREALVDRQRALHEILVQCGYLSSERAENLAKQFDTDEELAEHLMASGVLSEDELCKVLSLQSGLASVQIDCRKVTRRIARTLPAHIERRFGLVPFELDSGRLLLAAARLPPVNALDEIRNHTPLELELHLITRNNYQELREVLYG
jgi:adsorption protein B